MKFTEFLKKIFSLFELDSIFGLNSLKMKIIMQVRIAQLSNLGMRLNSLPLDKRSYYQRLKQLISGYAGVGDAFQTDLGATNLFN